MNAPEKAHYRIYTVMAVMCAAALVLAGQLIRWQVIEHQQFTAMAEAEHQDELVIPPRRGEIRDRNGHLLAADLIEYDLSVSPKAVTGPQKLADDLSPVIDMPRDDLAKILTSDTTWTPVAKIYLNPWPKKLWPGTDMG